MTTIPLRVCIAITTYKGQGITVGPGEEFERIVVHISLNSSIFLDKSWYSFPEQKICNT
jgi:hypothetical protein